jgi:F-type H+-transporting ATPase subunit gamma
MAGMREIRLRMRSISETQHITKAMKLISVSKLKKARQQLELALPFFHKVRETMADILAHSETIESQYLETRRKEDRTLGFIALTGDKGLAGGYNHKILELTESLVRDAGRHTLFVAGHLGRLTLLRDGFDVDTSFDHPVMNPTFMRAREMGDYVLDLYCKGRIDEVRLVYTRMISALKQEPASIKLLPLDLAALRETLKNDADIIRNPDNTWIGGAGPGTAFKYEPSVSAVFQVLIPKYISGIIYGALVEAFTSEQSARMTAMDSATDNAEEMLQKLNLFFNRARQAAITQEISEVVGGAAALQKRE